MQDKGAEDFATIRKLQRKLSLERYKNENEYINNQWVIVGDEIDKMPRWFFNSDFWVLSREEVCLGRYEWQQGYCPDRIIFDGCNVPAKRVYVKECVKPKLPALSVCVDKRRRMPGK